MPGSELARGYFCIVIHDVSPLTLPSTRRLIDMVKRIAPHAPLTLLVVPFHHAWRRIDCSPDTRRLIDARLTAGDELALHGFWHRDTAPLPFNMRDLLMRRVLTAGEAEFAALDYDSAERLLAQGYDVMLACGWQPAGFVPPAWQISDDACQALRRYPLNYLTRHNRIESLRDGQTLRAPALSFSARSLARRCLSRSWYRLWLANHAATPFMRLALHPADASYPALLQSWQRIIELLLHERQPITKGRWLQLHQTDGRSDCRIADGSSIA